MRPPAQRKLRTLAIVGGGRWARTFISTVSALDLTQQLVVVSRSNAEGLASVRAKGASDFAIVSSIDHLLEHHDVEAAVVVNAARQHVDTASRLIKAGVSVLVEKPLALHRSDVHSLYASAADSGAQVAPSLTFLHCSYLHNFAQLIREHTEQPVAARLEWSDPRVEVRAGEIKAYDPGISVAQDVMPHVWSVLAVSLGAPLDLVEADACVAERGGRRATFECIFGGTRCRIAIERDATVRRRRLAVEFPSGQQLCIDFSTEPGMISGASGTFCGDPEWRRAAKPVLRQFQAFLNLLEQPARNMSSFQTSIGSVALAESADALLKQQQASWLGHRTISKVDEDVVYAIGELACSEIYKTETIHPGDRQALMERVDAMVQRLLTFNYSNNVDWMSALRALTSSSSRSLS